MTRALELRAAFDGEFAAALPPPEPAHSDYLRIRIGGEPFAIALADIASLHADLRIVALPSRAPELLGVAALRAAVVPIYDAGTAFGMQSGAPRWIAVLRDGQAGFAFESFDGYVRIPDGSVAAVDQRGPVRGQFSVSGQRHSVVDLGSVLTAIETRWRKHTAKDA